MSRKRFLYGVAAVFVALAVWFILIKPEQDTALVQPRYGLFRLTVETTGELRAKHALLIYGPDRTRKAGLSHLTIQRLLPEGTRVKKGEVIAELDRSEIRSSIQNAQHRLGQAEAHYTQTQPDTALTLSKVRDQLVALRYTKETALLRKKETVYEPRATQRSAAIYFERAKRAYLQALNHYHIQVQQAQTRMRQAQMRRRQYRQIYQDLLQLEQAFTVRAPDNGMLIYHRDWRGRKFTTGSTISSWNPVVATLPDFSVMESVTYVDEVDVLKVGVGQPVEINLDAVPGKLFMGTVTRVANMGEQQLGSEAKLFEVIIEIARSDSTLRPAMTTGNTIIIAEIPNALQIPIACIHTKGALHYVFLKERTRIYRQEVRLGRNNEEEAIVEAGLDEADRLYLSLPADTSGLPLERLKPSEALAAHNSN